MTEVSSSGSDAASEPQTPPSPGSGDASTPLATATERARQAAESAVHAPLAGNTLHRKAISDDYTNRHWRSSKLAIKPQNNINYFDQLL